ncbi:MAG TPA: serine--tRNA ligase, partial [Bacteroidia bacterium]|nr:serine--tRNA ligase [Bacteroidia bacterium]
MLQINFIRQNADLVKERLAVKNFADIDLVDTILKADEQLRKLKTETESLQSSINSASKEIGGLMAKGDKAAAEEKKQEVAQHKTTLQQLGEQLAVLEKKLNDDIIRLPNLPNQLVPKGKTPEDNLNVKEAGTKPSLP